MKFWRLFPFLVAFTAAATCQSKSPGLVATPSNSTESEVQDSFPQVCTTNQIIRSAAGKAVGCAICPTGSDFQDEHNMQWNLKRSFSGRFTSTKRDNLILSSRGCESHSSNFGGSFVFLLDEGTSRFLRYDSSLITERCHKSHLADGRDFLICQDEWGSQGMMSTFLYAVRFDEAGGYTITRIFEIEDSTRTCGNDLEDGPDFPVERSEIESVEFHEQSTGVLSGLSVTATLGKRRLTKAERDSCEQSLKRSKYKIAKNPIVGKKYRVDFSFDGHEFKVVPASDNALKLFPEPSFPDQLSSSP